MLISTPVSIKIFCENGGNPHEMQIFNPEQKSHPCADKGGDRLRHLNRGSYIVPCLFLLAGAGRPPPTPARETVIGGIPIIAQESPP